VTPVLNKRQNYDLWQSGAFGNKLRAWRTFKEWKASGYYGNVVLRMLGARSGRCLYNIPPAFVALSMGKWIVEGVPEEQIMINEAAPDYDVILQGEYDNELWGCFRYSTARRQMRDALREASQETYGLRSDMLLRGAMTPSSYEDWRVLLDQYPDHVLEVSIYDRCLGDTPGRNALVWEVRQY
jgi:hypothetical protein